MAAGDTDYSNVKLLPCPFCGGPGRFEHALNVDRLVIDHADDCFLRGMTGWANWHFQDDSCRKRLPIDVWNRRAPGKTTEEGV